MQLCLSFECFCYFPAAGDIQGLFRISSAETEKGSGLLSQESSVESIVADLEHVNE